jgi:hypothetical protein
LKEKADTIGLDSSLLISIVGDDIEKKARRLHLIEPGPSIEE